MASNTLKTRVIAISSLKDKDARNNQLLYLIDRKLAKVAGYEGAYRACNKSGEKHR